MLKKKLRKKRKKETKAISELLNHEYFKKNISLKEILKESILCYVVGANVSSRIMSASFIERFIRFNYREFIENRLENKRRLKNNEEPNYLTYNDFLKIAKEKNYFNKETLEVLHDIKNIKNEYSHENIILIEFLAVQASKNKDYYPARTALQQLKFIDCFFYQVLPKVTQ